MAGLRLRSAGKAHLTEQNIAELLRRADGEGLAGQPIDLVLEGRGPLRQLAGEARENLPVDGDAALLHMREHGDQRPFEPFINARQTLGGKPRLQDVPEAERDVGVLGRIGGRLVDVDEVEAHRRLAGAGNVLVGDRRVAEPTFRERIHAVHAVAGIDHIGHQHRVVEALHGNAVPLHDEIVVFQVLGDLQHGRVFKQVL